MKDVIKGIERVERYVTRSGNEFDCIAKAEDHILNIVHEHFGEKFVLIDKDKQISCLSDKYKIITSMFPNYASVRDMQSFFKSLFF